VNKGAVAVPHGRSWDAARLSGQRLLALWNALRVSKADEDRGTANTMIDQLMVGGARPLRTRTTVRQKKRPSKQEDGDRDAARTEGATVDEVASVMGWQRHTVRGSSPEL